MIACISDLDAVISKCSSLPKIVIFDLDKTVWDVYAAEQTFPPYRRISTNEVLDSLGNTVRSYKDVPAIMKGLNARGILIALASLSPSFEKCDALLGALDLKQYLALDLVQIRQESSKLPHFRHIQSTSKVAPSSLWPQMSGF
jgi:magnesium-dependent phosphatase-1